MLPRQISRPASRSHSVVGGAASAPSAPGVAADLDAARRRTGLADLGVDQLDATGGRGC